MVDLTCLVLSYFSKPLRYIQTFVLSTSFYFHNPFTYNSIFLVMVLYIHDVQIDSLFGALRMQWSLSASKSAIGFTAANLILLTIF